MRVSLLLASSCVIVLACGSSAPPPTEPKPEASTTATATATATTPPAPTTKEGPAGFPLPNDADAGADAPGGGGKIKLFKVPRGGAAVLADVKAALQAGGWKIDDEQVSPKGAVRMVVSKGGTSVKVSILGDETQSGIILTVP